MYKGNIILLVLCLLAIVAGTTIYFEASAYQKKAKVTEGIVDYRLGSNYHVKYTSDDGLEHTLRASQKNNKHSEGDKLKVFYRIDNPDKARITDGKKGGKKMNNYCNCHASAQYDFHLPGKSEKQISDKV